MRSSAAREFLIVVESNLDSFLIVDFGFEEFWKNF